MNKKVIVKIMIDIGMTVALMLLMAFEMVGREAHEWIGMAMFILFIIHHYMNRSWIKNIHKGRYTPLRIVQLILVCLIFISMLSSMVSGILLSEYIFSGIHISGISHSARLVHILAAYWGFVLMALHLGVHWSMLMGMAEHLWKKKSGCRTWVFRTIGFIIAVYGIYAFCNRQFGTYLLLKQDFVMYNFEEPLFFLLLDEIAITGLFVWIGQYSGAGLRMISKRKSN